jgi:hypothetical protein
MPRILGAQVQCLGRKAERFAPILVRPARISVLLHDGDSEQSRVS